MATTVNTNKQGSKIAIAVIVTGAGLVTGTILLANCVPYANAVNGLLSQALGIRFSPLGWVIGVSGFAAVQVGEVYPLINRYSSFQKYLDAVTVSLFCYAIDTALAIYFWNPLKVPFVEWIQAPLMSQVDFLNVLIIFVTLFGAELFVRLLKKL